MAETNIAISKVARAIERKQWDAPHPTEVAELLAKKFGGAQGFVDAWFEQLSVACLRAGGKKSTLDAFKQMYEIFSDSHKTRDSGPDTAELTAAQIEMEMRICCLRMLTDDPELLRNILAEMGLIVVHATGDQLIQMKVDKTNGT